MDGLTNTTGTTPQLDYTDKLIFIRKPRCPQCESTEATTQRSIDNGDNTRTQRKKCKVCGTPFTVIWE
jgi:transposase-like protein